MQMAQDIKELSQLLGDAEREIRDLRRRNEILAAKVEVMDSFMCVLHTSPAQHSQPASIDVAWQLQRKIAEMEEAANAKLVDS